MLSPKGGTAKQGEEKPATQLGSGIPKGYLEIFSFLNPSILEKIVFNSGDNPKFIELLIETNFLIPSKVNCSFFKKRI